MSEYDNKMRGVLFKAKDRKSDSHPEYTGQYTDANGHEYWVSAWVNKSKSGTSYMSFQMREKDRRPTVRGRGGKEMPAPDFMEEEIDDSIPF